MASRDNFALGAPLPFYPFGNVTGAYLTLTQSPCNNPWRSGECCALPKESAAKEARSPRTPVCANWTGARAARRATCSCARARRNARRAARAQRASVHPTVRAKRGRRTGRVTPRARARRRRAPDQPRLHPVRHADDGDGDAHAARHAMCGAAQRSPHGRRERWRSRPGRSQPRPA
jgi:hypothetical protein